MYVYVYTCVTHTHMNIKLRKFYLTLIFRGEANKGWGLLGSVEGQFLIKSTLKETTERAHMLFFL